MCNHRFTFMNDLYSLALGFLNRFPSTHFGAKAVYRFVSAEVLCKMSSIYRVHSGINICTKIVCINYIYIVKSSYTSKLCHSQGQNCIMIPRILLAPFTTKLMCFSNRSNDNKIQHNNTQATVLQINTY